MRQIKQIWINTRIIFTLLGVCSATFSTAAYAFNSPSGSMELRPTAALPLPGALTLDDDCDDDAPLPVKNDLLALNTYPASLIKSVQADAADKEGSQKSAASARTEDGFILATTLGDSKVAGLSKSSHAAPSKTIPTNNAQIPDVPPVWDIALSDKTLNAALSRWAANAGWQMSWELSVDYAVEARTIVPGSFEEAIAAVIKSMETAEIPMKAIFYNGNKVLRIVPRGAK